MNVTGGNVEKGDFFPKTLQTKRVCIMYSSRRFKEWGKYFKGEKEVKWLHKNIMMLCLSSLVVIVSLITHVLHRQVGFLQDYLIVRGMGNAAEEFPFLLNLALVVPIVLLCISFILYKINRDHKLLPLFVVLTLTASSISIIAGGDGLVEYHFSIFMVLAMIAYYNEIKLLVISTLIFAVHHLGGYFLFPELLCGVSDYSFALLLVHAFYLLLTSGATIWFIYAKKVETQHYEAKQREQKEMLAIILNGLNQSNESVKVVTMNLTNGSIETAKASEEIASAIGHLNQESEEQINHLNSGTDKITRMLAEISQMNQYMTEMNGIAKKTTEQADNGQHLVYEVTEQMNTITKTISSIDHLVKELKDSSQEIEGFIKEVTNIADQTNLLALNASIEAARAGEHGKGFAVVAAEVRKLASQSEGSASQVQKIVQTIQGRIDNVVRQMNVGLDDVHKGAGKISQTDKALSIITEYVREVDAKIEEVSTLSNYLLNHSHDTKEVITELFISKDATSKSLEKISMASDEQFNTVHSLRETVATLNGMVEKLDSVVEEVTISMEYTVSE
jgi:methyl-accepting chemotaxis protein